MAVPFSPSLICPRPPRYVAEETILVFLHRDDRNPDRWRTCHLSYGTRVLASDDVRAAYVDRVREFSRIEAIENEDDARPQLIECLVKCVEHPPTRWDGAYEISYALNRNDDNMFLRQEGLLEASVDDLTPQHRARLMRTFLSVDREARGRYDLRRVVTQFYNHQEVEEGVRRLRRLHLSDEDVAASAQQLMIDIAAALGWQEGRALAERLGSAVKEGQRTSERLRIVGEFRKQAGRRNGKVRRALRWP